MSFMTTLYSIDYTAVFAAIGSNDTALQDRALAMIPPTVPPGHHVVLTESGDVVFEGKPMTEAAFSAEIRKPRHQKICLICHDHRVGNREERVAKSADLNSVVLAAHNEGIISGLHCWQPHEWPDENQADIKQAIADLITGTRVNSTGDCRYLYADPLEVLCTLSSAPSLSLVGGLQPMLLHLGLDVPFSKSRVPLDLLPGNALVSYLTNEQVQSEAD
ncbi:MAG: hypothetical protein QM703_14060 [Gemmatales bacterium]